MTWEKYYNSFSDWDDRKKVSMIYKITDFPDADEIIWAADELPDNESVELLVTRATDMGVCFTCDQIEELETYINDESLLKRLINNLKPTDADEITEIISGILGSYEYETNSALIDKAMDAGMHFTWEQIIEFQDCIDEEHLKKVVACMIIKDDDTIFEDLSNIDDDEIAQEIAIKALNKNLRCTPAQLSELADRVNYATLSMLAKTAFIEKASEVTDVLEDIDDDDIICELTTNALNNGLRFTPEQIMELEEYLDVEMMSRLVDTSEEAFTKEQLSEIEYSIDSNTYDRALKRAGGKSQKNGTDLFSDTTDTESHGIGLFASLFKGFGIEPGGKKAQKTRRCDGDCAHCPPHYGYRYGRWYYGHHHTHGCEFHGNKEGDLSD